MIGLKKIVKKKYPSSITWIQIFFETFELQDIETMIIFIMQKMKCNKYYPVKSEKAREIIKIIIDEELFPSIEFNSDYTKIRNVSLVY